MKSDFCLNDLFKNESLYSLHSRIHRLKSFGNSQTNCYVKRDDELGFGISGSKVRKYSSLIPYLKKNNIKEAILIGGAYSNNIVSLTQLLIENKIHPILFLRGEKNSQKIGNFLLILLMVHKESIHWVSREDWQEIDQKVDVYAKEHSKQSIVIGEGANVPQSLTGALTLAFDILKNEDELQTRFDHIFVDAGTGTTACALLLAFVILKRKTMIHIVLMANKEPEFLETLLKYKSQIELLYSLEIEWGELIKRLKTYHPDDARSFGSTNKNTFEEIRRILQIEGFLTDPIYSVKLFMKARSIISDDCIKGNCLIVHSGGGLTLMGFQEKLAKLI